MPIFLFILFHDKIHAIKINDENIDLFEEAIVESYIDEYFEKKYPTYIAEIIEFQPKQGLNKKNPIKLKIYEKVFQPKYDNNTELSKTLENMSGNMENTKRLLEKIITHIGLKPRICIIGSHDSTNFGSQQRHLFRIECIKYYEINKCMITGDKEWEAAHIIAASSAGSIDLGRFELLDLWQPQNALLLSPWLHKEHFDKGHCTIVYNALRQKYMLFVLNPFHAKLEEWHGTFLKIDIKKKLPNQKALMMHATEACRVAIQSGWLRNNNSRLLEFETFVELSEKGESTSSDENSENISLFFSNIQEHSIQKWKRKNILENSEYFYQKRQ